MLGKNNLLVGLGDAIKGFLDGVGNIINKFIVDPVTSFFGWVWGEILKGAYTLWTAAASIIDSIQVIFGMLVGTVSVSWQSGSGMGAMVDIEGNQMTQGLSTNNMILDIFLSEYVLGAFWKILILSIFLLLIFTIIAIIKNEYSTSPDGSGDPKKPETQNNKMIIIKRAVRSLMAFLCVPLACIFGVVASGYLMQALDAATSITGETMLSNKMFELCASGCNRVRTDNNFYIKLSNDGTSAGTDGIGDYDVSNGYEKFPEFQGKNPEDLASLIDDYFVYSKELPQGVTFDTGDSFANFKDNGDGMNDQHYFNTKNPAQVFYYYDLAKFEWLIAIATIFWMLVLMIKLVLGAAVRLYELAILFIISPAIISMAPLDNGEALGKWQKKFIGKTTMVFAPVLALNLYFILVATLMQVDFTASISNALTSGTGFAIPNELGWALQRVYNIMIAIAGLMVCENAMSWLGELIGAEDMKAAGDKLQERLAKAVTTGAAGKFLLGGGSKIKTGAGRLASAGIGKAKGGLSTLKGDRRDRDVTASKRLQSELDFRRNEHERYGGLGDRRSEAIFNQDNHDNAQATLNAAGYDNDTLEGLRDLAMGGLDAAKDKYGNDASLNSVQKYDKIFDEITKDMQFGSDEETQAFKDYMKKDYFGAMSKDAYKWADDENAKAKEEHEANLRNMKHEVRKMSDQEKRDVLAKGRELYKEGTINKYTFKDLKKRGYRGTKTKAGISRRGRIYHVGRQLRRSNIVNGIDATLRGTQYDPNKRRDEK